MAVRRQTTDKGNDYRKIFSIDRFARHWYCQHARLNQLRSDKREAKRKLRRQTKEMLRDVRGVDYEQ